MQHHGRGKTQVSSSVYLNILIESILILCNRRRSPERLLYSELCASLSQIMDESPPRPLRSTFAWLVGASQVLGLASVVLTGVWMGHYRGGFAWDGSAQEFNLHPLCMVLGLVFLQGDGESTQVGVGGGGGPLLMGDLEEGSEGVVTEITDKKPQNKAVFGTKPDNLQD